MIYSERYDFELPPVSLLYRQLTAELGGNSDSKPGPGESMLPRGPISQVWCRGMKLEFGADWQRRDVSLLREWTFGGLEAGAALLLRGWPLGAVQLFGVKQALYLVLRTDIPEGRRREVVVTMHVLVRLHPDCGGMRGSNPTELTVARDLKFRAKAPLQCIELPLNRFHGTLRQYNNEGFSAAYMEVCIVRETDFHDLPTFQGALEVLGIPELYLLVGDFSSLRDVASLSRVCRVVRPILRTVLHLRFSRIFGPYFNDLEEFFALLRLAHGVVGGSSPLWILQPGDWFPADLDLIFPLRYSSYAHAFLLKNGYITTHTSLGSSEEYPGQIDSERRIYFNYYRYERQGARIDLSILPGQTLTPVDYILTYHSTAVMNFFDGIALHCLFPRLTFNYIYWRNMYTPSARMKRGLNKVESRGYLWEGYFVQSLLPSTCHDDRVQWKHLKDMWLIEYAPPQHNPA